MSSAAASRLTILERDNAPFRRGFTFRRIGQFIRPALLLVVMVGQNAAAAENIPASSSGCISLEQLLSRMEAGSRQRERMLAGYTAMRTYRAANGDDSDCKAEMQVKVAYRNPSTKDFAILSEEGSGFIRDKVFKKAMETEKEAQHPESKQRAALSTDNYYFGLIGEENLGGRHCYVVEIRPKRKDKFLVRGHAWVDSVDFAVVRIEGELVKPPSFLIRKVNIVRDYAKVGDFWLPQKDVSTSQLLLLGKSTMTVQYYDYTIQGKGAVMVSAGSVSASLK